MKVIMLIGEYGLGILMLIVTVFCLMVGFVIALFEFPKYLRNSHK